MSNAARAGAHYFAIVFAAGFILGTIRVLLVLPHMGETAAVLLELPVMLTLSWIVCARLVRGFSVPGTAGARLLMGALAFALLMTAEAAVSIIGFGRSLAQHLAAYRALGAQLGLLAQLSFAAIPVIQARLTAAKT